MQELKVFLTDRCLENESLLNYMSTKKQLDVTIISETYVWKNFILRKKLLQKNVKSFKIIHTKKLFKHSLTIPEQLSKTLSYLKLLKNQDKIIIVCGNTEVSLPLGIWNELIVSGVKTQGVDITVCHADNLQSVLEDSLCCK